MQLKIVFAVLAACLPFVSSTAISSSCKKDEFWWNDKKCCLPKGGPPQPPQPPKGSNCPPTSYYWNQNQGCCTPRNPPPSNPPPPQCPKNWDWSPAVQKCVPTPTPPTPPPTKPSSKPGDKDCDDKDKGKDDKDKHKDNQDKGNGHKKRDLKARQTLCPNGFDACPVTGLGGDYECVDFATELESCGGCPALGKGQDCTAIAGAWNVGCEQGSCVVYTCAGGFKRGGDGKSCVPF